MRAHGRSLSPGLAARGWRAVAGGHALPGDCGQPRLLEGGFHTRFSPCICLTAILGALSQMHLAGNCPLPREEMRCPHRARRSSQEESGVVIGGMAIPWFLGSQTDFCPGRGGGKR